MSGARISSSTSWRGVACRFEALGADHDDVPTVLIRCLLVIAKACRCRAAGTAQRALSGAVGEVNTDMASDPLTR